MCADCRNPAIGAIEGRHTCVRATDGKAVGGGYVTR